MLACIDPGKKLCGVALFSDRGYLLRAELVRANDVVSLADAVADVVKKNRIENRLALAYEMPQVYMSDPGKAKSLFPLALTDGAVAHALRPSEIIEYKPHDWKGSVDPDVMTKKIQTRWMTAADHKAVVMPSAKSLAHNIFDAIGIGIYHLRRLGVRQ
jgi:hypothetical protein